MRVLIGMPEPGSAGGPAACEPPFVDALRRTGVSVDEETYVFKESARLPSVSTRIRRVVSTALAFRRRLSEQRFDVLHLNTSFDLKALLRDVSTTRLIGARSTKLFLKFHGSDADLLLTHNTGLRLIGQSLLARADGIGVLSCEERSNFLRAGIDRNKVFVVKNAVSLQPANSGLPTGNAENLPVLLFIARFIPAKGLMDVIRACALLRDRGVRFLLTCVGDGPERTGAEAEALRLGLGSVVKFTGYIPEPEAAAYYNSCTLLVFPTYHYEGFPMVIFNALAAGKPIVTTRIRAAADYLNEPANCLWVEPRNPAMLANRIETLLTDSETRRLMGKNNSKLARCFAAGAVAEEYKAVYSKILRTA